MRTLILGSCVTRDALEFQPADRPLELVGYFARSSLASGMHPAAFDGVDVDAIPSAFQRRMVASDLTGAARDAVSEGGYDVLVVDLIDERFDVVENAAGARATRSPEFLHAGYDVAADTVVRSGSAEAFAQWEAGWSELVALLQANGRLGDVRVNRVRWAEEVRGGGEFPAMYSAERIAAGNAYLEQLYARMAQDLRPQQFWTFAADELDAAASHKWGVGPFHYVDAYYLRLVDHLLAERDRREGSRWARSWGRLRRA